MDVADTERGYRARSDEDFTRSMAELKRFLAQRAPASPPAFEFDAEAPGSREVAPGRNRFGALLLYVAIAAATAAGLYAYGRVSLSPHRVEVAAPPVAVPPPAENPPSPSSAAVMDAVPAPPAVESAPPPPSTEPPPVPAGPLGPGEIAELQVRLRNLGFPPGAIDGVAGPLTVNALKRYQRARGRAPTGDLTTDTLADLRREPAR